MTVEGLNLKFDQSYDLDVTENAPVYLTQVIGGLTEGRIFRIRGSWDGVYTYPNFKLCVDDEYDSSSDLYRWVTAVLAFGTVSSTENEEYSATVTPIGPKLCWNNSDLSYANAENIIWDKSAGNYDNHNKIDLFIVVLRHYKIAEF